MPSTTAIALLILRVSFGLTLAAHGVHKAVAMAGDSGTFLHSAGGPFWAWGAVAGELLGGLGLAVGFMTRLAGVGVAVVMIGVVLKFHLPLWRSIGTGAGGPLEYPALLAAIGLAFAVGGPGPISLDGAIRGRGRRGRVALR